MILTEIFLTVKKNTEVNTDDAIFLESHKEHRLSQNSCIYVRTSQSRRVENQTD